MGWGPSWLVTTLSRFLAASIVVVEIFLNRHVISQDHVTKKLCDFLGRSF